MDGDGERERRPLARHARGSAGTIADHGIPSANAVSAGAAHPIGPRAAPAIRLFARRLVATGRPPG
jgi:hypothetical protein